MMHAPYGGDARTVRRTTAMRKGTTLPPNLSDLMNEMTEAMGEDDGNDESSQVEIRRTKGRSLNLTNRYAVDYGDDDYLQLYDDHHHHNSNHGNEDDDDFDDFTDEEEEEEDEIIYENPTDLVAEVQNEQKRVEVAKEIMHSEHTYLEKLTFLRMIKRQLDSMNSVKHIFPPEEPDRMFPCIEQLFQFHSSIKTSLERTMRTWDSSSSSIAKVFLPKLTEFKIYREFIRLFPLSIKTLELWREKEERFNKLLTIFQQHSSVCLFSLQDVMHEPYIRLQKLNLLLQRYKKCLPSTEQENNDIEQITKTIDSILHDSEGQIQLADNLDTLLKLAERIDGVLNHFGNETRLVKEGAVLEVDPRGKHVGKKAFNKLEKQLHLLLFNDFILICSPLEPNKKQTIECKVKVSACKLLSCDFFASMGYDAHSGFVLQTPAKARLIVCPTAKDKQEWTKLLEETISTAKARRSVKRMGSLSTANFSCAPIWIPDDYVSDCMLCLHHFTIIRRRHHCRGCGIIVCSDCSPGKIRLPYDNQSPGRVCRNCFRRAKKQKQELVCPSAQSSVDNNRSRDGTMGNAAEDTVFTFENSGEMEGDRGEEEI